jgi:Kef-type K+ transport system membrane component KefB
MLAEAANATSGDGMVHHGLEVEFYDVQMSLLFLIALWIAGKAVGAAGMPALVGELLVGVVMGPQLLGVVPSPESLMLYGEVGLILLVVEAGLDVDLQMLRTIGPRGVGVAVTGTLLPVAIASAVGAGALGLGPTAALAAGCTLAPTSMGIALNVLKRGQVQKSPKGDTLHEYSPASSIFSRLFRASTNILPPLLRPAVCFYPLARA